MLISVYSVALAAALGANPAYPGGPAQGAAPQRGMFSSGAVTQAPYTGGRGMVTPVGCNGGCSTGASYGGGMPGGYAGGYDMAGPSYDGGGTFAGYGGGGGNAFPGNEPLYPYDSQYPWMHGYFQEMPAYGGFVYFRPYNYKHVMPQSQAAGGWGMQPTMPYSQQFWHRYRQNAAMSPALSSARRPAASAVSYRSAPVSIPGPRTGAVPVSYTKPAEVIPPAAVESPEALQRFSRQAPR